MYTQYEQVKTVDEIESIFKKGLNFFFIEEELKLVENKNKIKSLGARYMIKKSILDYLNLTDDFYDIIIKNTTEGKPIICFLGNVKSTIEKKGIKNTQISISHSKNFIATLIITEKYV